MIKFKTIKNNNTAEIEEKRSKFIASIFYVDTVKEAQEAIKCVKRKYYDAKHNCFAYIIQEGESMLKKFSDDGEPSGTAGSPILNTIEKTNLCNVLIIVTRYFGGTLLGTGGLVRAYTEVSKKAIDAAGIIEQELGYIVRIEIPYQDFEKFKYYCNINEITIKNVKYIENIVCEVEITRSKQNIILSNDKIPYIKKYEIIEEKYIRKQGI